MTRKRALITGASGQDGLALADFLSKKNYEVLGLALHSSSVSPCRVVKCDIRETAGVKAVVKEFQPDEIYNLAGLSSVGECQANPDLAFAINFTAWVDILDFMTEFDAARDIRLFQASSSEVFGNPVHQPQTEGTPFAPRNVYGETKARAHEATLSYRAKHGLKASNGILYNHEGPDRGPQFVTRKITRYAAALKAGSEEPLQLGDLDVERDWGHVRDTVRGMWLMLQQDRPDDFILATGKTHTVRQFAEVAFEAADLPLKWVGEGINEQAHCRASGRVLITLNSEFMRHEPTGTLVGDASKACEKLGWSPKTGFRCLVREMMAADIALREKTLS